MDNEPTSASINKMIALTDGDNEDGSIVEQDEAPRPSYKKYSESRIPVSKHAGSLWKSRIDIGRTKMKDSGSETAWDEAIAYYKNDQTGKRNRDDPNQPGSNGDNDLTGGNFARTENIVFANVSALVPSVYAKNPDVTVHSPRGDEDLPFVTSAQKLIRTLMQKRTSPGVNMKPKMRRAVVLTTLTNLSFIEVGYTRRENAVEGTLVEIDAIAAKLEQAKNPAEIEELEGQLIALDEKVDLLHPAGPFTRVLHPKDVIIDADCTLSDLSDAKWIAIRDVHETSFINAVYRQKNEQGEYTSIYKPDAVLKANSGDSANIAGHSHEINNFSLLTGDKGHDDYGYDDENSFNRAQRTFVWKIWDRVTRRVYMYAENDWSWPIWVWDDPYGLEEFFPVYPLSFHTDPEELYARGEVSYYLDQQDEINLINSQIARMRHRVSNQLIYNKRAVKNEKDIINLVNPTNGSKLVGVDVPDGMKISDMVSAPPIPAVEYSQLFDKRNLLESIDRVSGVSAVVKGVEFKTNTTNKAIDSYESSTAMRLDEKIDSVEEIIGRVGHAILIMCLQFMSKDEVAVLIGAEHADAWPQQMSAVEAKERFHLTVIGGSSLKATSKVRKEQAKENAQIIGQFGASNPVAFLVVLKMFQRAFSDELTLEPTDWDMIIQAAEQQISSMMQQPAGSEGGQPPQGGQQPPQEGAQPQINPQEIVGKISEAIQQMPDDLRAQVGKDIADGVPLQEVLGKLQQIMQQQQQ